MTVSSHGASHLWNWPCRSYEVKRQLSRNPKIFDVSIYNHKIMWIYTKSLPCPTGWSPVCSPSMSGENLAATPLACWPGMCASTHRNILRAGTWSSLPMTWPIKQVPPPWRLYSIYDMGVMRDMSYFNRVTLRLCKKLHFFSRKCKIS